MVTGSEHEDERPSLRSRWTLAVAVVASVLLLGATVLWWQQRAPAEADPSAMALPGPWEPPTAADGSAPAPESPIAIPTATTTRPAPDKSAGSGKTTQPTTTPAATTRPATNPPAGPNLSLGDDADADGSSRADGTRFGNVRDGDVGTFWSPNGTTGEVSVKFTDATTLSRITIREASGGGAIGAWRVRDYDTGAVLTTGTGAGVIAFSATSLRKITFEILTASGTPRVGEFETFGG